jgi:hypothetical protein
VSGFLWLVFAALVVFAAVQLAMWMIEWVLEDRGRRRPSPDHVARRLRG